MRGSESSSTIPLLSYPSFIWAKSDTCLLLWAVSSLSLRWVETCLPPPETEGVPILLSWESLLCTCACTQKALTKQVSDR